MKHLYGNLELNRTYLFGLDPISAIIGIYSGVTEDHKVIGISKPLFVRASQGGKIDVIPYAHFGVKLPLIHQQVNNIVYAVSPPAELLRAHANITGSLLVVSPADANVEGVDKGFRI